MNRTPEQPVGKPVPRHRAALRRLGTALGPFVGLILVYVAFGTWDLVESRAEGNTPTFFTVSTVQAILRDASLVGVAALGMTMIIIAGGIDLSAGAAIALCATVTAWFFREGHDTAVALAAGIGTGWLCGLLNGALISKLRVVPFIVTLGTMTIFLGLGLILAEDTPIRAYERTPLWVTNLQTPYPVPEYLWGRVPLLVPTGVWLMFALAAVVGVLLRLTVFGRHVFAVGSNEAAARLCGVNVTWVRVGVYSTAGLFVGVAGIYQFAILGGEGDPNAGMGKELEIIAAAVIGGASLSGGRGSIVGTLSGAWIMATIFNGCVTLGIPTSRRQVILGAIIIAAVTLDQILQLRLAA